MPEEAVVRAAFDALRRGVVSAMARGRSFCVIDRPGDDGLVAQAVGQWVHEGATGGWGGGDDETRDLARWVRENAARRGGGDDDDGMPPGLAAWRRRTGWTAPVGGDADAGVPGGASGLDEVPTAGLLARWRMGGHPAPPDDGEGDDVRGVALA